MRLKRPSFVFEAFLLGLLLIAWAGSLSYLYSGGGLRAFARQETAIDLLSLARPPARRDGEVLVVPGGEGAASRRIRFRPLPPLAGDTTYIVIGSTDAGLGFHLTGRDRATKQRLNLHVRKRVEPEALYRFFRLEEPADSLRLRIEQAHAVPLTFGELSLYEFSSAHGTVASLLRWVPAVLLLAFLLRHRRRLRDGLASPRRVDEWFFALLVFAVCLWAFHRAPVHQIIDSKFLSAVSHSLLHNGTVALPEDFWPNQWTDDAYQLREVDGRVFHYFPAAPAIFNLPFIAVYEAFGVSPIGEEGNFRAGSERRIFRLAAAFVAAGLCALLYVLGRLFLRPAPTLALVAAFAFGSQIYSTISRPFWSHAWATLLLSVALVLVLKPTQRTALALAGAATALSWSFFCRPTMSLSVLGICGLLIARRRAHLAYFFTTGALWAGAFLLRNLIVFGGVVPIYFSSTNFQSGRASEVLLENYPHALLGNLVSPGRGLLIFVPLMTWIVWALVKDWRQLSSRDLAVTALLVIVAHWQVISLFGNWTGGKSFGPRLFSDIVPWLFLLGALTLETTLDRARNGGLRSVAPRIGFLVLAVCLSLFVNVRGAWSKATWDWSSFDRPPHWVTSGEKPTLKPPGIWNWRYPQFMAGLLPKELNRRSREP